MAYKRSIILINPKFQIKFSLLICLIILIATSIYPFVIYDNFSQFIAFSKQFAPKYTPGLIQNQKDLIFILLIWQTAFFILAFGIMIFFTHKVAGPLYKLKQFLKNLREEKSYKELYFRGGDYFQDIADEYNSTLKEIHENTIQDSVYLGEVQTYMKNLEMKLPEDKKIVCRQIQENIQKLSDNYHL